VWGAFGVASSTVLALGVLLRMGIGLYTEGAFYHGIFGTSHRYEGVEVRVVAILLGLTLVVVRIGFSLMARSRLKDPWPTNGMVEVKQKVEGEFPAVTKWEIRYSYDFQGRHYKGRSVTSQLSETDDERLMRYEVGKLTPLIVDASNPGVSVLMDLPPVDSALNTWMTCFFGAVVVAMILLMVMLFLRG